MVYCSRDISRMIDHNKIPYDQIGKLIFYLTPIVFQYDELKLSFSHDIGIENELTSRVDIACFGTDDSVQSQVQYGFSQHTQPVSQAQRLMKYIHQNVRSAYGPYKVLSDNSHLDPCVTFYVTDSSMRRSSGYMVDQDSFVKSYRQTVEQVELAIANFFENEDAASNTRSTFSSIALAQARSLYAYAD